MCIGMCVCNFVSHFSNPFQAYTDTHTHARLRSPIMPGGHVAGIFSIFRGVNDNKSMSTSLEKVE